MKFAKTVGNTQKDVVSFNGEGRCSGDLIQHLLHETRFTNTPFAYLEPPEVKNWHFFQSPFFQEPFFSLGCGS